MVGNIGNRDGTFVEGRLVGIADGVKVGIDEGEQVGVEVGIDEGGRLGGHVEVVDGKTVGLINDGKVVGKIDEGETVDGRSVGEADGRAVGDAEGIFEGPLGEVEGIVVGRPNHQTEALR